MEGKDVYTVGRKTRSDQRNPKKSHQKMSEKTAWGASMGGQKTCGFSVKDHFGLVPSYIIQSVLAMLICRRSCRTFSMNSGSTKDRPVTASKECSIFSYQMVKHSKKILVPSLVFYPLSSSIIILSPTVIQFCLGVI